MRTWQNANRRDGENWKMSKMTAIIAQPVSERTYEICRLLAHADLADNNCRGESSWTRTGERRWAFQCTTRRTPRVSSSPSCSRRARSTTSRTSLFLRTRSARHAAARTDLRQTTVCTTSSRARQACEGQTARNLEEKRDEITLGGSAVQLGQARRRDAEHASSNPCPSSRQQGVLVWTRGGQKRGVGQFGIAASRSTTRRLTKTSSPSHQKVCALRDSCGSFGGP